MNYTKLFACIFFLITFKTNMFSTTNQTADLYELYCKIKNNIESKFGKTSNQDSFNNLAFKLSQNNQKDLIDNLLKTISEFAKNSDSRNLQETINQLELICSMAGLEESLISTILQNNFDATKHQERPLIRALLSEIAIIDRYIGTLNDFVSNILDGKNKNKAVKPENQKASIIAKIDELNAKIQYKESLLTNYQKLILQCKLELELKTKNYQTRSQQPEQKTDLQIQEQIEENETLLIVLKRQCQIIQDELDELMDQTKSLEDELLSES